MFPGDEFTTTDARDPGKLGMELMAQVRGNGRMQDHFRIAIGGSEMLTVQVELTKLLNTSHEPVSQMKVQFQVWPRDIDIRRNATTSAWMDVYSMIKERNAIVYDNHGEVVPLEDMAGIMNQIERDECKNAVIRWAVIIGDEGKLELALTSLPASLNQISGRPPLKR